MSSATFSPREVALAATAAAVIEAGIFVLLVTSGAARSLTPQEEALLRPVPIAVKPVLDELPLLRKGGKRVKAKLPDMWVKRPPIKRFEAKSAPSEKAPDEVEKIPDTPLATRDAQAPPPDAEIAKKVDEDIPDTDAAVEELNVDEEGAQDGVDEGTETDPLKARAVSLYRIKIISWFASRFHAPSSIPCAEMQGLRASVSAQVGSERTVTGFTVTSVSGNAAFDAQVEATMKGIVAGKQELPPPPPRYPDILDTTVFPAFIGKGATCKEAAAAPPNKDNEPSPPSGANDEAATQKSDEGSDETTEP